MEANYDAAAVLAIKDLLDQLPDTALRHVDAVLAIRKMRAVRNEALAARAAAEEAL